MDQEGVIYGLQKRFSLTAVLFFTVAPPKENAPASEDTINKAETAKQKIIDGSIKVPVDETELMKIFPGISFMK